MVTAKKKKKIGGTKMKLNKQSIVEKVEGLNAVLNEPISGVAIPDFDMILPDEQFNFTTGSEFLDVLETLGETGLLEPAARAEIVDGVLTFGAEVGSKG